MRICLIGKAVPRIVVSKGIPATSYIHALAKEFVRLGHKVDVVCGHLPDTKKQPYNVVEIGGAGLPSNICEFLYGVKVGLWLRKVRRNYDVVHFLESPAAGYFSLVLNRHRSIPFLFSTGRPVNRDGSWHGQGATFPVRFLSDFMHSYVFRKVDRVIASSQALADSLRRLTSRVCVAPFISVEAGMFMPAEKDTALLKELGLIKSNLIVLCPAEVAPYKNQLSLVKAIPQVINEFPNARFVFVGGISQGYYAEILEWAKANGIARFMYFTGYIKLSRDLPRHYNLADVFALVSEAEGNLPKTVLSAMACGKPCVVSDLPQNKEWAGDTIRYVGPYDGPAIADAVKQLLGDEILRRKLGDAARLAALRHHHPLVVAAGILRVYKSEIEKSG